MKLFSSLVLQTSRSTKKNPPSIRSLLIYYYLIIIDFFFFLEFCLRCCVSLWTGEFEPLAKLKCLERLDFYNTEVPEENIIEIIRSNVKLRHLNLGKSKKYIFHPELVAAAISESCPSLETLEFEFGHFFHGMIRSLSHCENLRELDIRFWQVLIFFFYSCYRRLLIFFCKPCNVFFCI